jgi:uncharacterized membrane protein YeaQ/YmgE (transglycosylase-associated protein family)
MAGGLAGDGGGVDFADLVFALVIGVLVGALGHLVMPHRRAIPLWFTMLAGVIAAVLGSLVAGAVGVGDSQGFEWVERTLQLVFAIATVLNIRTLAGFVRVSRHH